MAQASDLPPWLDRASYPWTPRTFDTSEGRMRYLDEGEGPAVLLVHGTPSWSFEWREVVRALAPRHRVIVPDHLGFGLSDKPDAPEILAPADHARRLRALVSALELRDLVLVVHDFGGPIGLPLALEEGSRVRAVVVTNTWMWAHEDPKVARLSRFVASPLGRWLYRRLNASPRWLVPSSMGDRRKLTRDAHRHYLAPFGSWAERAAPWKLGVELAGSSPYYASLWAKRSALASLPLEIVWGTRDPAFTKRELEQWQQSFPHARTHTLDVGHFVAEEAPQELASVIASVASR
ncbi:alpha/beta fold hydrolase [Sandaracinus amylolyticus]|uniref:alpha/beta fold hydrolase n=1 Tax=Sandaracinus amylolyticus TaxID=927083 RepID=UPI001F158DA8|nr:alpha/beta fold hydrolase [Sandaracinus amylolyticus]UJR85821.1 Hypothetical protein I5071_79010 [Sandaracinus amylolyticus]